MEQLVVTIGAENSPPNTPKPQTPQIKPGQAFAPLVEIKETVEQMGIPNPQNSILRNDFRGESPFRAPQTKAILE